MENMRHSWLIAIIVVVMSSDAIAAKCGDLAKVILPNTTITSVQEIAAGQFVPEGPGARPELFKDLPAFCRINANLKPTTDSDINVEIWLPNSNWNGNFQPVGPGLWGGNINFNGLAGALRGGYATATSDTGHRGTNASFAVNAEKLKDFAGRAFHETVLTGKALLTAFYGNGPRLSYSNQCGGGTREALAAMQRFPADLDAVAITGVIPDSVHHTFAQMWVYQATHKDEASYIPPAKYPLIHQAALAQCDAQVDGVKDGLIENPPSCRFDPKVLECRGADGSNCLTPAQVEAARKIYTAPANSRTGQRIFSPLYPGSELGWGTLAGSAEPFGYAVEFFKWVVYEDPNWNYKTRPVNFDSDLTLAERPDNAIVNVDNPDIGTFFRRGGKLLMFGGWNDAAVAPGVVIDYYNKVVERMGTEARDSVRMFMVPGMQHCPGTTGRDNLNFDSLAILRQWKENGKTPNEVVATRYQDGKDAGTRLVCAYPGVASYKGTGSVNDAASFTCKAP